MLRERQGHRRIAAFFPDGLQMSLEFRGRDESFFVKINGFLAENFRPAKTAFDEGQPEAAAAGVHGQHASHWALQSVG